MIIRWLKRIILGVLLVVLASLASISALVATEDGSRWLIGKVVKWLPAALNINIAQLHITQFDTHR